MTDPSVHTPVLARAALAYLAPVPGPQLLDSPRRLVDCNLGDAGHSRLMLEAAPESHLYAFELDTDAIARATARLGDLAERVTILNTSFGNIEAELTRLGVAGTIDGLLADVGLSYKQATTAEFGFSFMAAGPLTMTYDLKSTNTAASLLASATRDELVAMFATADILPREAAKVAEAIIAARATAPLATTTDFAALIARALGRSRDGKRHVATRYFLALRTAVTGELIELERALPQFLRVLRIGGTAVLLTYSGGESRLVRQFLQTHKRPATDGVERPVLEVLTKHPVKPDLQEIRANKAARSALLRAFRRIA